MKRTIMLAALLFALAVPAVQAQICGDLLLNIPKPSDKFGDMAETGIGAAADMFLALPLLPIKIGGHAAYNKFGEKDDTVSGATSIVEIGPAIRYSMTLPFGLLGAFVHFGAGMYSWSNDVADGNDYGYSIGAGVTARILPTVRVVFTPGYTVIKSEGDDVKYMTFGAGIAF